MVDIRSIPGKAFKVFKTFKASKGFKSTFRTAAKGPVGVSKPRKAPKPFIKARTQQGRFLPTITSLGIISPDEIPETEFEVSESDLGTPKPSPHRSLQIRDLYRYLVKLEDKRNSYIKGKRVIDDPRRF